MHDAYREAPFFVVAENLQKNTQVNTVSKKYEKRQEYTKAKRRSSKGESSRQPSGKKGEYGNERKGIKAGNATE